MKIFSGSENFAGLEFRGVQLSLLFYLSCDEVRVTDFFVSIPVDH